MVIFARHPSGRVKTRLLPALTAEQALRLHWLCLYSTARLVVSLPKSIARWLYLTPPKPGRRVFLHLPWGLRTRRQRGRTLGTRLRRAFEELVAGGYQRLVFIGSDSPTLPGSRLRQALAALGHAQAVLGPARDGGCYLIGLRGDTPRGGEVFRGIAWGTRRAFRQTLERLRRAGQRTVVLSPWYDVDVPADLRRLRRDLRRSRAAALAPLRAWFARSPR